MKYFIWTVLSVVGVAVVVGFWVAGSPTQERQRKIDAQRVSDLMSIQWSLVSYWQAKQMLPESLAKASTGIEPTIFPHDPVTGVEYGYARHGTTTIELCATFDTADQGNADMNGYPTIPTRVFDVWSHPAGYYCFSHTIDPDFYPPTRPAQAPAMKAQ